MPASTMPLDRERPRPIPRPLAWALVVIATALVVVGLILPPQVNDAPEPVEGDIALYRYIIKDVRGGQAYYPAAVAEHRLLQYPLQPFLTMRPPTLAVAMAALPNDAACRIALGVLGVITAFACAWRAKASLAVPVPAIAAVLTGLVVAGIPPAFLMHEAWAGLFITLSLALHDRRLWPLSLAAGLMAVAVRELAAPYLLVMAVFAWREGHRIQAAAWGAGILAFVALLWLHAATLQPFVQPDDLRSPGWLAAGGWPFVLKVLQMNSVTLVAPHWVTAVLAPIALVGLVAWKGPLSDRVALTVLGFCLSFLVIGRANNQYWGLLIAPLWPIGLVGIWTLIRSLHGSPRKPV